MLIQEHQSWISNSAEVAITPAPYSRCGPEKPHIELILTSN